MVYQYLFNHACLYNNNLMHLSDADQFIIEYGASIWGSNDFACINAV